MKTDSLNANASVQSEQKERVPSVDPDANKDAMREFVLNALDDYARETYGGLIHGWSDADLPALFKALDAHCETLQRRHAPLVEDEAPRVCSLCGSPDNADLHVYGEQGPYDAVPGWTLYACRSCDPHYAPENLAPNSTPTEADSKEDASLTSQGLKPKETK